MDNIKETVCINCFKSFEYKDSVNNRCPSCMDGNVWKQWKGFKRLHAVKWYDRIDNYISACSISQPYDFVEPEKTNVKCKNCEREIRKARTIQLVKKG